MQSRYVEDFNSFEDLKTLFEVDLNETEVQIIFAIYEMESYEGWAWVVYKNSDNELFEVCASHCSCYGLEGQWNPEPTTVDAIKLFLKNKLYLSTEHKDLLNSFLKDF